MERSVGVDSIFIWILLCCTSNLDENIPSLTVYKKGKRLKASYFKAFSRFSFCFELCYILSCVIFVVLFL